MKHLQGETILDCIKIARGNKGCSVVVKVDSTGGQCRVITFYGLGSWLDCFGGIDGDCGQHWWHDYETTQSILLNITQ